MIYFDPPTTRTLMERLCRQLYQGGYLVIGHSESMSQKPDGMAQAKPSIYRKT